MENNNNGTNCPLWCGIAAAVFGVVVAALLAMITSLSGIQCLFLGLLAFLLGAIFLIWTMCGKDKAMGGAAGKTMAAGAGVAAATGAAAAAAGSATKSAGKAAAGTAAAGASAATGAVASATSGAKSAAKSTSAKAKTAAKSATGAAKSATGSAKTAAKSTATKTKTAAKATTAKAKSAAKSTATAAKSSAKGATAKAKTAAKSTAAKTKTSAAKTTAAKKPAAKKAPAKKAPAKTPVLYTSRPDTVDDLKLIKGVGPKMETTINKIGVYQFAQVGNWKKADVKKVDGMLEGFNGRIERDEWVKQAKILARGGETEFSKRNKK